MRNGKLRTLTSLNLIWFAHEIDCDGQVLPVTPTYFTYSPCTKISNLEHQNQGSTP